MRALEEHLDAPLFDRRSRGVRLDRRGRTHLGEVQRILGEFQGISARHGRRPRRVRLHGVGDGTLDVDINACTEIARTDSSPADHALFDEIMASIRRSEEVSRERPVDIATVPAPARRAIVRGRAPEEEDAS